MLGHFEKVLRTIPFSSTHPGITGLVIRAVDSSETAIEEHDLRAAPATPEGCIQLCRDHEHSDCCYEARAHWDIWSPDAGAWKHGPHPVEVICHGQEFDHGAFREAGHFQVDLGFSELFAQDGALSPLEKIRQNIHALHQWLQRIQAALPVVRYQLWSEDEENFAARMDDVLARS